MRTACHLPRTDETYKNATEPHKAGINTSFKTLVTTNLSYDRNMAYCIHTYTAVRFIYSYVHIYPTKLYDMHSICHICHYSVHYHHTLLATINHNFYTNIY